MRKEKKEPPKRKEEKATAAGYGGRPALPGVEPGMRKAKKKPTKGIDNKNNQHTFTDQLNLTFFPSVLSLEASLRDTRNPQLPSFLGLLLNSL
jgi:hypothetical protein